MVATSDILFSRVVSSWVSAETQRKTPVEPLARNEIGTVSVKSGLESGTYNRVSGASRGNLGKTEKNEESGRGCDTGSSATPRSFWAATNDDSLITASCFSCKPWLYVKSDSKPRFWALSVTTIVDVECVRRIKVSTEMSVRADAFSKKKEEHCTSLQR